MSLYVDEKEPVTTTKTHGGTSWSSTRVKVEKAFVDFLKRVEKRYSSNIQNIFLVLDNLSVHKSKKAREVLAKDYPRIKFGFLPVKSPELNLIELEDGHDGYKDGINNSTFKYEQEIGKSLASGIYV
ncbi:MAG TPA: transposase [Candidatus Sulfopaludibacter sp.]|nr:transposase [Candidatus Sulfopaludibacter sp.]